MKAGLFICDHVNSEYQSKFGDYPDMFAQLFPEFEWKLYDVINGAFPSNLDECDVYLATGSRHSSYEDLDWINQLKQVIQDIYAQNKCFIGFCFGHQLLGLALGGKVEKSPNGWCVGAHDFEILNKKDWMSPFQDSVSLLMMCQDQVIEMPENSTLLASAEKCPVGIFQVGERMLGIQAHPEFSKAYDQLLMENRIDRMGKKLVNEGIESLKKEIHANLIRDWVMMFVKTRTY